MSANNNAELRSVGGSVLIVINFHTATIQRYDVGTKDFFEQRIGVSLTHPIWNTPMAANYPTFLHEAFELGFYQPPDPFCDIPAALQANYVVSKNYLPEPLIFGEICAFLDATHIFIPHDLTKVLHVLILADFEHPSLPRIFHNAFDADDHYRILEAQKQITFVSPCQLWLAPYFFECGFGVTIPQGTSAVIYRQMPTRVDALRVENLNGRLLVRNAIYRFVCHLQKEHEIEDFIRTMCTTRNGNQSLDIRFIIESKRRRTEGIITRIIGDNADINFLHFDERRAVLWKRFLSFTNIDLDVLAKNDERQLLEALEENSTRMKQPRLQSSGDVFEFPFCFGQSIHSAFPNLDPFFETSIDPLTWKKFVKVAKTLPPECQPRVIREKCTSPIEDEVDSAEGMPSKEYVWNVCVNQVKKESQNAVSAKKQWHGLLRDIFPKPIKSENPETKEDNGSISESDEADYVLMDEVTQEDREDYEINHPNDMARAEKNAHPFDPVPVCDPESGIHDKPAFPQRKQSGEDDLSDDLWPVFTGCSLEDRIKLLSPSCVQSFEEPELWKVFPEKHTVTPEEAKLIIDSRVKTQGEHDSAEDVEMEIQSCIRRQILWFTYWTRRKVPYTPKKPEVFATKLANLKKQVALQQAQPLCSALDSASKDELEIYDFQNMRIILEVDEEYRSSANTVNQPDEKLSKPVTTPKRPGRPRKSAMTCETIPEVPEEEEYPEFSYESFRGEKRRATFVQQAYNMHLKEEFEDDGYAVPPLKKRILAKFQNNNVDADDEEEDGDDEEEEDCSWIEELEANPKALRWDTMAEHFYPPWKYKPSTIVTSKLHYKKSRYGKEVLYPRIEAPVLEHPLRTTFPEITKHVDACAQNGMEVDMKFVKSAFTKQYNQHTSQKTKPDDAEEQKMDVGNKKSSQTTVEKRTTRSKAKASTGSRTTTTSKFKKIDDHLQLNLNDEKQAQTITWYRALDNLKMERDDLYP